MNMKKDKDWGSVVADIKEKEAEASAKASEEEAAKKEEQEKIALEEKAEEKSAEKKDSELEKAEDLIAEQKKTIIALHAEIQNLHKRHEAAVIDAHKYGIKELVLKLLPVIDSLEKTLVHKEEFNEPATLKLYEGVELALKMFVDAFNNFGVTSIDPLGEVFNPDLHSAMTVVKDLNAKPNTVLQVLQKGYILKGRVIRPAMVVVAE
jgi:molecular chaperone GrpE